MKFTELNLSEKILKALDLAGYKKATEVQEKSVPSILNNQDVVVRSQTGSGKTMAYVLPIVQNIDYSINTVQALIVCPTRELALQVADETTKITTVVGDVRVVTVYGGSDIGRQIKALKRKPQIVIGTPGRLMDHMRRKTLKLHDLKTVVLDEADEMLNMGFKDDIEKILKATPKSRQTLLFSATYPDSIRRITKNYQRDAVSIEVGAQNRSLENIKQFYVMADRRNKKQTFINLFKMVKPKNSIIFCNTKRMVEELDNILRREGFASSALHGDLRQSQRRKVMNAMKSGKTNILVASDVAARGIDIDNIDYVFNFDLPNNVEYFLHRIGRTARAGKKGSAITIVNTRQQFALLKEYEKDTKSDIEEIGVKVHTSGNEKQGERLNKDFNRNSKGRNQHGRSGAKNYNRAAKGSGQKGRRANASEQRGASGRKNTAKSYGKKAGKSFEKIASKNTVKSIQNREKNFESATTAKTRSDGFKNKHSRKQTGRKNTKRSGGKEFETRKAGRKNKSLKTGSKFIPNKRKK